MGSLENRKPAAKKVSRGLLCWFSDFREFIDVELGQTEPRGPHEPPGRALTPWARSGASWATAPSSRPLPKLPGSLMSKKLPKSFVAFGLRLVLIFYKTKNKQKIATGTRHYVNRLVPKNDI